MQPVLVAQVVKDLLGVLAAPVADHREAEVALEAEVGLEPGAAHPLERLVQAPVAAPADDALAVNLDDKERRGRSVVARREPGGVFRPRGDRREEERPARPQRGVPLVDHELVPGS